MASNDQVRSSITGMEGSGARNWVAWPGVGGRPADGQAQARGGGYLDIYTMSKVPVKKIAPCRIQLRRIKGFRLQQVSSQLNGLPAVNVARPSRYGNPYKVGMVGISGNQDAVKCFRRMLNREDISDSHRWFIFSRDRIQQDLRGKNLACWCGPGDPCHADVLLEIANE